MIGSPAVARSDMGARTLICSGLALLAGLLLVGCGPTEDPQIRFAVAAPPRPALEAAAAPHFTDGAFVAEDGARLPLRKWLPRDRVGAVILALHGFGDYGNAFAMPAARWADRGIATYAFDQRGFGEAPVRGIWAGAARMAVDAIEAAQILRRA